jgi:DNA-binding MarR family transcriptional regulator
VAPPEPSELDLGSELERRVAALWSALVRAAPSDLSRTSASVLARLRKEGPQRVTALAASEHVAQPSMSLLVQRLVKRGLVERQDDPLDRRASRIAITPEGAEVLRERAEARSRWLRDRIARLREEDRGLLVQALELFDVLVSDGT